MPSDTVLFLTRDEALAIHARLIEQFGGAGAVRDEGLLESALFRPQTGYYADLAEMAAALFESLLMNHAFTDGNKRVAFFATDVFLRLNGWPLDVDDASAHTFIVGMLERREASYARILDWLRKHLRRR